MEQKKGCAVTNTTIPQVFFFFLNGPLLARCHMSWRSLTASHAVVDYSVVVFSSDKKKQKQVFSWKFAVFGKQKMNPD